jgi:hypothetical protein
MGIKRDREKERLKKHKRDKKIAKAHRKVTELIAATPSGEQLNLDSLATGHLRRIVDNPPDLSRFSNATTIHALATTALTERLLQLERER